MLQKLKENLAIDLRSLAVMRILLSLVLIYDWVDRLGDAKAFYSNDGVLPLATYFGNHWNYFHVSLFTLNGAWEFQSILILIGIFSAACVLLGYKTKLFTLVSWLLLISVHNRNPLITQGGDDLMRLAFFWMLFLPWGKFYSIDSIDAENQNLETRHFSWASIGWMLQLFSVYFFSGLLKTSAEWHEDGTALYYALSLDQMLMPFGKLIYHQKELLVFLSKSTFYLEVFTPLLFIIPFKTKWFRTAGALLMITFHAGTGLMLFVGLFFAIGISCLTSLLPGEWFDKFFSKIFVYKPSAQLHGFEKPMINYLAFVAIFYILFWNMGTIPQFKFKPSKKIEGIGRLLRIDQNWGMFAPGVFKDDGWYIMQAETFDGDTIDINRNGKKVDFSKPDYVLKHIKNDRWRKFQEHYILQQNQHIRLHYCLFLRNEWNEKNPDKLLKSLSVIYMMEFTEPDYKTKPVTKEILAECR